MRYAALFLICVLFVFFGCARSIEYTYIEKGKKEGILIDNLYANVDLFLEIQPMTAYNKGRNYIATGPYQIKVSLDGYKLELANEIIFHKIILSMDEKEYDIRKYVNSIYFLSENQRFDIAKGNEFSDNGIVVINNEKSTDNITLRFGDFEIEYNETKYIQLYFNMTIINTDKQFINIIRRYTLNRRKIINWIFPTT
jgi:hypothetical protein